MLDEYIRAQGSAQRPLDAVHGAGLGNTGPIDLREPMTRNATVTDSVLHFNLAYKFNNLSDF